ncbi:MAG: 50S ribosomal protein L15 [Alphaproteobacteria bacterium]|nr:50S ribosomal protein L15 [Alphaproteobacteria bacterium]
MDLNQLADKRGARKNRKRIGRGPGSGKGGTAGRGAKGQLSRSGVSLLGFEGGQMPLYRRLPRRGFNNPTSKRHAEVNLGRLQAAIEAGKLDAKKPIDGDALIAAGVVRRVHDGVRLLAKGDLKTKISIEVAGASKAALAAVEKAGGTVTISAGKSKPAAPEKKATKQSKKVEDKGAADSADTGGQDEASD